MNFLNARTVRLVSHYKKCVKSTPVFTEYDKEQIITVNMNGRSIPHNVELVVHFSEHQRIPKKLSLSVNQYTMNPFEIEVKLTKKNCSKPYYISKMGELRTVLDIEPDTRKLILSINQTENIGKYATMRIGVNYIAF